MPIQHLLLAILTVTVWGFNFVVIQVGLHTMSPLFLCAMRFLFTGIPAIFFIKRPQISWRVLISYGLVMYALQFCCLFMGIYMGVTSSLAALIVQTQVLFTVLLAALFLNEKPSGLQLFGILTAFSGIALVGSKLQGSMTSIGFIVLLMAAGFWSAGNLLVKTIRTQNMFGLVIWGNFIAFFPTMLIAFLVEGQSQLLMNFAHFNFLTLAAISYLAYCSTMLGYGCWTWLVTAYPIATIAPYALLVPIIGFTSSALVFQEPLELWQLCAASLVILGLCINIWGNRRVRIKTLLEA